MLYKKIYDDIIHKAKNRILEGYCEKHHIIPKCLGGDDSENNLVKLTFREHFICHHLLCKIYPKNSKLIYAFSSMIRVSKKNEERFHTLTSRHFNLIKTIMVPHMGKWNLGRSAWNKGITGEEFKSRYKNVKPKPPVMTGWKWINDSVLNRKIPPNTEIPEGWVRGRCNFSENNPMKDKKIANKNANLRKKNES